MARDLDRPARDVSGLPYRPRMARVIVSACAAVPLAALLAVARLGRRQTRGLCRGGPIPARPPPPGSHHTSPTTHLAWLAGLAMAGWAADPVVRLPGPARFLLAGGGLFVAVTGWAGRVRSFQLEHGCLTVRYRAA